MKNATAILILLFVVGAVSATLAFSREDLLFYASLDEGPNADYARGNPEALAGLKVLFEKGKSGKALRLGENAWADTSKLKMKKVIFTKDIDIYHDYGGSDTVGALRYEARDNIRADEGTLAFWMKPVNWTSGGRDRFIANLGMADTLALFYSPYWAYDMFENYKAPRQYTRALVGGGKLRKGRWEHIVLSWRKDMMGWWQNGVRRSIENQGVVPLANPTGTLAFGDGSTDETVFDDILILARAVTDEEAKALHYRLARKSEGGIITTGVYSKGAIKLRGWTDRILGVASEDPTEVYLRSTGKSLVIRLRYPIPEKFRADRTTYVGQPLDYDAAGDDPEIFDDDYFDVMIRPGDDAPVYRFAVNGAGKRYDARDDDLSWNGAWKSTNHVDDHNWVAAFEIPYEVIGAKVAEGTAWGINFGHGGSRVDEYGSIWAFTGPDAPMLGTLRFVKEAAIVRVDEFGDPGSGSIKIEGSVRGRPSDEYTIETEVSTTCIGQLDPEDKKFAELNPKAPPGWKDSKTVSADAKGGAAFAVEHILTEPVAADLLLTIRDASGAPIYFQRRPFAYSVMWNAELGVLPSLDRVIVALDAGSQALVDKGIGAKILIKDEGGKTLVGKDIERMKTVKESAEFSTKEFALGDYSVETRFIVAGKESPPIVKEFKKPGRPVWMGNKIGVTDKVIPPWTPLELEGDRVSCWGRTYDFSGHLLPGQITVLNKKILAAPVRVKLTINGKERTLSPAKLTWGEKAGRRISWRALSDNGSVTVKTDNWVEFDGFMWTELSLEGKGTIDKLALEIPLKPEYATHWYSGQYAQPGNPTGYTPKEYYSMGPPRAVRIGGYVRGIQWCWETEEGWHLKEKNKMLELIPGKDKYIARLNFIDAAVELGGNPRTIALGMQALPCKPYPGKGWRDVWWAGPWKTKPERPMDTAMTAMFWNGEWWFPMKPHWNYPNITEKRMAEVKARVMKDVKKNHGHCFYMNNVNTDANTPEYRIYGEEWRPWPTPRPDFSSVEGNPDGLLRTAVCYGAKSYLDFYLYYIHKLLSETRKEQQFFSGAYIDCSGPVSCANPYHGHGWIDENGERRPTWAILAQRNYMQRLCKMFDDLGDNTWITVHMSGLPLMSVWGYADVIMPGEQFASFFVRERARYEAEGKPCPFSYIPYVEMDRMRAEFMGTSYGVPQAWLEQLWSYPSKKDRELAKKYPDDPKKNVYISEAYKRGQHHFTGMCMVHDTINWGGSQEESRAFRLRFKSDESVEFLGYWMNQDVCTLDIHDEQKYVCSLMRRPERLLLLPFNNTDEDVTATVTLDLEKLGFPQFRNTEALDLITREKIKLNGRKLTFRMPARRIRLLLLGQEWQWAKERLRGLRTEGFHAKIWRTLQESADWRH